MTNKIILSVCAAACLAACAKKAEEPKPEGAPGTAADQVGVSTAGVVGQTLNAPGNYVRGLANSLDKAKKVSAMVNQKAAENEKLDEQYKDGGN